MDRVEHIKHVFKEKIGVLRVKEDETLAVFTSSTHPNGSRSSPDQKRVLTQCGLGPD